MTAPAHMVLDSLDDLVMVIDASGVLTGFHKPVSLNGVRLPFEEAVGKPFLEGVPAPIRPMMEKAMQAVRRDGGVHQFDCRLALGGGENWFSAKLSALRDASGAFAGVTMLARDISDRRREQAGRANERRLGLLFEYAPDGYFLTDHEGTLLDGNRAFEELFGCRREELVGRNLLEAVPLAADALIHGNGGKGSRRREPSGPRELTIPRRDGTSVSVEIRSFRIQVEGRPLVLNIARDITELARAVRELRVARAEAEAANRAKSEFLANTSHELRTPLTAILGFSEILETDLAGPLNDRQRKYVQAVHGSGEHLLALINDILDLSKVDYRAMRLELSEVHLRPFLARALSIVQEKAAEKGVCLTLEVPEATGRLVFLADERKLKQILYNLLSNAVKFTPQGGRITVGARRQKQRVSLFVRDTGIGVAAQEQERIFDEFYQLKNRTRSETSGTGLGLALTRRLVTLHGGTIRVESEGQGKGSCFICTLPLMPPAAAAEKSRVREGSG